MRVRRQLRQRLEACQHNDGDQFTGSIVEHAGLEDVSDDEPAQDLYELGIVVGYAPVPPARTNVRKWASARD